jgi:hypothetical protein
VRLYSPPPDEEVRRTVSKDEQREMGSPILRDAASRLLRMRGVNALAVELVFDDAERIANLLAAAVRPKARA